MDKMKKIDGTRSLMGIKMDISKDYGKMEWEFILKVLKNFGMLTRTVKIIRQCISLVSSGIVLNGSPLSKLKLKRGLQQGDLLSPY